MLLLHSARGQPPSHHNPSNERICPQCGTIFVKLVNGAGYRYCSRECMLKGKRAWDKKPESKIKRRLRYLETHYGIKPAQLVAMLETQDGKCAVCRTSILFDKKPISRLHYCPRTKKLRGLVCSRCKKCLAQFYDNPQLLRRAAAYLES